MNEKDFTYDHKLGGYPSKLDVGSKAQEHEYWMQRLRRLEGAFCLTILCLVICVFILAA
jgi:hypothetical protein